MDQLTEAGCLTIGFTGGEPFLRRDIFDVLGYAKNRGVSIVVLTNGTLITPKKADGLKEIGVNKVDVSFHTTNEEVFEWFTRVPGTYTKVLRAVKLLRERGIEVYLKTTAMSINRDDLVTIRHLAIEKFGAHFRYAPIVNPRWDGKKDNLKFRLSPEEIDQFQMVLQKDREIESKKSDPLARKRGRQKKRKIPEKRIRHDQLFRCGAGRSEIVINPYGEMRLCMDIPYPKYHILKGSFAEGWKMLSDHAKNTPPGPSYECRDCELAYYCNFCPAKGWLESGDMSACPPYYREMARLAKAKGERENAFTD